MNNFKDFDISICVILLILFMYLIHLNASIDNCKLAKLDNIVYHKNFDLPKIKPSERLVIESVIEDYLKKRKMNKSNCSKIWNNVKNGAMRGALGGAIVGSGISGAAAGAVIFGAIGGLNKAYNLTNNTSFYLRDDMPL